MWLDWRISRWQVYSVLIGESVANSTDKSKGLKMRKTIIKNDVHFLQVIGTKIVINDNYDGILVLDCNLNLLKKIKVFDGVCIYSSFITGENEMVLFCPEDDKIAYINIEREKVYIMDIPEGIKNEIISRMILNNTSRAIFKTNKGKYVALDKENKRLEMIEYGASAEMEKKQIWDGATDILKNYSDCNHRDVKDHSFVAIYEEKIIIYNNQQSREIFPEEGYIFNNAKIMDSYRGRHLVVLSNKKADNSVSALLIMNMK